MDLTPARAKCGGSIPFDRACKEHRDDLYRFLYSMVCNSEDAEDVLQETFEAAYRHQNRWPNSDGWRPWLFTIARNKAITLLRRRALLRWLPLTSHPPDAVTQDPGSETVEQLSIESTLRLLPPPERVAFVLRLQGFRYEEIASICGVTPAAIRTRIHRSREKLRQALTARENKEG